ncbi:MAG: carbohydrate ABC transporter permease [Eubacteriales bacterium]|nr:carbohydrate ABC transporter permease [Eubacteriales bacterium]
MRAQKIKLRVMEICTWIFSLVVLIPLLLIVVNAFKTPAETAILTLKLPQEWQFSNFSDIFAKTNIVRAFLNSVLITVASVGGSVLLGTTAGYVLSRRRDSFNNKVYAFFLIGMIVPVQIIALVEMLQTIHMMDSYIGMIMVYIGMFIPQTVFLVYGFVGSLPQEMDEAGIMDGCSAIRLFVKIMLPLMKPVVVTLFITQFVFVWNDFQLPLYLIKSSSRWTIVLGVYNFLGQYSSQWNMVCAYILVSSAPVVLVYLMGQKYIIDGMVAGAVKG